MSGLVEIKVDTHTVIKNYDVEKYLSDDQKEQLECILCTIGIGRVNDGKAGCNTYYICNTDEPYAENIYNAIKQGEFDKDPRAVENAL